MKPRDSRWYRWKGDELMLALRVQPRAGRDEFVAPHGDHYKVRIAAAPVEGKANEQLLRFLANSFGVSKSQVSLMTGENSRNKGVRIRSPRKLPIAAGDG